MKRLLVSSFVLVVLAIGQHLPESTARSAQEPAAKPAASVASGQAAIRALEELKRISPPPWVVNPPPKNQKPIYGLPLDIHVDVPEVPAKIAAPAPPIAEK